MNKQVEIDDLRHGIGVIANVMLLGQSADEGCFKSENKGQLLESLCKMTETYADKLIEDCNVIEKSIDTNKDIVNFLDLMVAKEGLEGSLAIVRDVASKDKEKSKKLA